MSDFKTQLESLVNEAAIKQYENGKMCDHDSFKACAEFLIPVLMKAIESRDYCLKDYLTKRFPDVVDESYGPTVELLNKELLNILKDSQ